MESKMYRAKWWKSFTKNMKEEATWVIKSRIILKIVIKKDIIASIARIMLLGT